MQRQLETINVSLDQYYLNREFISNNPTAFACHKTLCDHLLVKPIVVRWGGKPVEVKDAFRRVLERKYKSFVQSIILEKHCRGFVPTAFVLDQETGHVVPIVPDEPHRIALSLNPRTRSMDIEYHRLYSRKNRYLYSGATTKKDKKIKIFKIPGFEPFSDGTLNTPISELCRKSRIVEEISMIGSKLEMKKLHPDLVIESNVNTNSRAFIENVTNVYTDKNGESDSVNIPKGRLVQYMKEYNILQENKKKAYFFARNQDDYYPDEEPAPQNAFVKIPEGFKYTSQVAYEPSNQFKDRNSKIDEDICAVFGVPKSVLTDSNRSSYSGLRAGLQLFNLNLERWRTLISSILTECYNIIYGEADAQYITDNYHKGESFNIPNNEEMAEIYSKTKVEICLELNPTQTFDELTEFYERGLLEWENYYRYSMMTAGVTSDDILNKIPKEPVFTDEERVAMKSNKQTKNGSGKKRKAKEMSSESGEKNEIKKSED